MMLYTSDKFLSQQITFNTFLFQFRNSRFQYVFIFNKSFRFIATQNCFDEVVK